MYIFVCVPAAGRIAPDPAIAWNRVGPLSAQSTSVRGRVGARGGHGMHRKNCSRTETSLHWRLWRYLQRKKNALWHDS